MQRTNLESLRKSRGLLQKDVAEILGIPKSTYASYEQGKAEAGYDVLKRLARLYDVSLDFLLSEPSEEKGTTLSPRQARRLVLAFKEMRQAFEEAGLSKGQESRSAEKRNECTDKCTIAEKTAVRKREKDN